MEGEVERTISIDISAFIYLFVFLCVSMSNVWIPMVIEFLCYLASCTNNINSIELLP